MWIALIIVFSLLTGIVGVVLSIVYLALIRPRVKASPRPDSRPIHPVFRNISPTPCA